MCIRDRSTTNCCCSVAVGKFRPSLCALIIHSFMFVRSPVTDSCSQVILQRHREHPHSQAYLQQTRVPLYQAPVWAAVPRTGISQLSFLTTPTHVVGVNLSELYQESRNISVVISVLYACSWTWATYDTSRMSELLFSVKIRIQIKDILLVLPVLRTRVSYSLLLIGPVLTRTYYSVCESTFLEIYFFDNCPEGRICGKFLKKLSENYLKK